jgi:hypothetical protein
LRLIYCLVATSGTPRIALEQVNFCATTKPFVIPNHTRFCDPFT